MSISLKRTALICSLMALSITGYAATPNYDCLTGNGPGGYGCAIHLRDAVFPSASSKPTAAGRVELTVSYYNGKNLMDSSTLTQQDMTNDTEPYSSSSEQTLTKIVISSAFEPISGASVTSLLTTPYAPCTIDLTDRKLMDSLTTNIEEASPWVMKGEELTPGTLKLSNYSAVRFIGAAPAPLECVTS